MYSFDGLVEEVLRNKPNMTRSDLLNLIEEKKRAVGAGYLTDQGALFLIAGELGVQLRPMTSDLTLKDLYVGANDITIVARVLAVYPISEYKRKDGGAGRYRRVSLFDGDVVSRLTVWDDNLDAMELEGVSADTLVRVSNGYVRQGLDGKPNLNLGRRGRIEVVGEGSLVAKTASLATVSKSVEAVGEEQVVLALRGVAASNSRSSNFVRRDGTQGCLTQFDVASQGVKNGTRIVIWDSQTVPEVRAGQSVLITNLRTKKGYAGLREFHGDAGSLVRVSGPGSADGASMTKVNLVSGAPGLVNLEVMVLSKGKIDDVDLKDGTRTKRIAVVIGDDTGELTAIGWRHAAEKLLGVDVGKKIRIIGASPRTSKMGARVLELAEDSDVEVVSG